jgi:hypothetical protein
MEPAIFDNNNRIILSMIKLSGGHCTQKIVSDLTFYLKLQKPAACIAFV